MRETQFIEQMLKEAASLVREKYAHRAHLEISSKKVAADLLTEADLAAQDYIVGLCSVAAGEYDGFMHVGLNPWDYAASSPATDASTARCGLFSVP